MEDILQQTLGLTLNESRIYKVLIEGSPLKIGNLSKHTNLPRTRVYEVLASLAAKGFLERRNSGNYRLIPPQESLPLLVEKIEKENQEKTLGILDFSEYLQQIWKYGLDANLSPGIELYRLQDLEPLFLDHLGRSRHRVWIAVADKSATIDTRKSTSTLMKNYQNELDVRFLTNEGYITGKIARGLEHFSSKNRFQNNVRTYEELSISFVLIDETIYIYFFGRDDIIEATGLRTSSIQLVKAFSWMFDEMWAKAEERR